MNARAESIRISRRSFLIAGAGMMSEDHLPII